MAEMASSPFLSPRGDVGGVIVADLRGEFEIGAQESGAQLGNEFLGCIAFVAPALASEIALKTGRMLGPVRRFVRERGVKRFSVAEALYRRHLDIVGSLRAVSLAAPVANIDRKSVV